MPAGSGLRALAEADQVLPWGTNWHSLESKIFSLGRQERAARTGVSRYTQQKLDYLALNAPDLLEMVRSGEVSIDR